MDVFYYQDEIVAQLISDFFQERRYGRIISLLNRSGTKRGYEKWIQVELAAYISSRQEFGEIELERSHGGDQRRTENRFGNRIDIVALPAKPNDDLMCFIEIKIDTSFSRCVASMIEEDADKVSKMRKSDVKDLHFLYCLGIHERVLKGAFKEHIDSYKEYFGDLKSIKFESGYVGNIVGCSRSWSLLCFRRA